MRVSLEWFLLDNFAVNWLLLKLAGALGGAALPPGRAACTSLLGAMWDLVALGKWPRLLSLPGRIACLLVTALLISRREYLRAFLSLFEASLLLGGALLLLTLGRTGPWTGGVLLGTVPLRVAIYGFCVLPLFVRAVRYLVHRGYEGSCTRTVTLTVGGQAYTLTAFVDSGNLLTEPLSGLPVVLVEGPAPGAAPSCGEPGRHRGGPGHGGGGGVRARARVRGPLAPAAHRFSGAAPRGGAP